MVSSSSFGSIQRALSTGQTLSRRNQCGGKHTGEHATVTIGVLAIQGAFIEHISSLEEIAHRTCKATTSRGDVPAFALASGSAETCSCKIKVVQVRCVADFAHQDSNADGGEKDNGGDVEFKVDGLVIPGGESTTMALVAASSGMLPLLQKWVRQGRPTWGTCAGLILLSNEIVSGSKSGGQDMIGGLDIKIHRNYYGSQLDSFTKPLNLVQSLLQDKEYHGGDQKDAMAPFTGVFIRAPYIEAIGGVSDQVKVLATLPAGSRPDQLQETIVAVQGGSNLLGTSFHPELTDDVRWHEHFVELVKAWKGRERGNSVPCC